MASLLTSSVWAFAARPQQEKSQLPANPADLVRSVINNELRANAARQLATWKERDEKPRGVFTKLYVETPDGVLGRLIAINDRPMTGEEIRKEDERVNRLLDPDKMQEKKKEQKEDEERTTKMLKAIPDAFIFDYAGNTLDPNGHSLVSINFRPNPGFSPPTREALVFQGMQGSMILDTTAYRIVKIDGTLFRDVSIGWGIVGRLDKGGRFYIEQAEVFKGHWDQTRMILDFTGKALIFKSIKIKENSTAFDFKPVDRMSVAQALDFLRKEDPQNKTKTAMSRTSGN